ncbi:MAG: hypothetical protein IT347_01135 [Candidatus Eisenbacteria bacterium]|nr:hypothetical protein [Candidatus Eisenbacteria bacterium]
MSDSERPTTIVPFEPGRLDAVRAFSEQYWSRPSGDDYYVWRYLAPVGISRMFLALRGEECVGTLFALRKTWRLRGARVPCLEVFDWHALAEVRGAGAGIRLMRAMMRSPERIFSIGGTADVHSTLPLMRWTPLSTALAFELPLSASLLGDRLHRSRGVPRAAARALFVPLVGPMFAPRPIAPPGRGEVVESDSLPPEVASLYEGDTGYDLVQQPDPEVLGWLTASRWSGRWRFLRFHLDGRLRGWAMTRLYAGKTGLQGSLVEVFAPRPEAGLYAWMVAEACRLLAAARPSRILARATCPVLRAALARNRFRRSGVDAPVYSWPAFSGDVPSSPHVTYLHSDAPIQPYDHAPEGTHES